MLLAALLLAGSVQTSRGDKTIIQFTPTAPCRVVSVSIKFAGKLGKVELHFWKDIGSPEHPYLPYSHFEFDLAPLITAQVGKSSWTTVRLRLPIELRNGERLFIGGWFDPSGPTIAADPKGLPAFREKVPAPNSTEPPQIEPQPNAAVRVSVQRVNPDSGIRFRDVTVPMGLAGVSGQRFAWGDVDGDGYEDLLVDGHRLFLNRRGRGFQESHPFPNGAPNVDLGLFADVDRDGDLDLLTASEFAASPATVWINDGHGHFTAMPAIPNLRTWTFAASWFDANGDGYPDLYIGNGWNSDKAQPNAPDCLWLNQKGHGFFDASATYGIDTRPGDARFTRATVAADFDDDGIAEVLSATFRLEPDRFWKFGKSHAQDLAPSFGLTGLPGRLGQPTEGNAVGAIAADIDGDGQLDLMVSNLVHPDWRGYRYSSEPYVFFGKGTAFRRVAARDLGIGYDETPANPVFADFDLDGDLDMIVNSTYHRARLFEIRGGRFVERTLESGLIASQGTGLAVADFNQDGLMDVVLQDRGHVRLFQNVSSHKPWAGLRYDRSSRLGQTALFQQGSRRMAIPLLAGLGMGNQNGWKTPIAQIGQSPMRVSFHGGKSIALRLGKYTEAP